MLTQRMLCRAFRPPKLQKIEKVTTSERTRISYFTALPAATYAALRKESRMKSTEVTVFDRKSGGAEGPAVRPGSHTKVSVPLVSPQNCHPMRTASQIVRVTQRT